MRAAIAKLLADGEVIELEVSHSQPIISAPYHETFGMFRDDPTFPDFLVEVEKYRQHGNNGEND